MRLHENQLKLIHHLARFNLLDYSGCLHMLDETETGDQVALSYVFRPLTKNKYLIKRKDGSVAILAKGKALFPDIIDCQPFLPCQHHPDKAGGR